MTIRALGVAIKDGIQNHASRLYVTLIECELERPKLVIVPFHMEGKKAHKIENLDYKIFIFPLKETEVLGVDDVNYDLDCALCWALSVSSTHMNPLFPCSADQGTSLMHSLSKHLLRVCYALGPMIGS